MNYGTTRFITAIPMALAMILGNLDVYAQQESVVRRPGTSGRPLYNGILLPEVWPPENGDPYTSEPMPVPYLEHRPEVVPIDIGRQLFVDDFLIEQTDLDRVFHQAQKYAGNPVLPHVSLRHGGVFYDPVVRQFGMFYNDGGRGIGLAYS